MYRKNTKGWYKHLDFIVLDLLCLQVSFFVSYWLRLGFSNPYASEAYRNMGILVMVFDVIVILMYGTLSGVIKRGKYEEFSKTVKHTVWLLALTLFYLFAAQVSSAYSRLAMFLMFVLYFCASYLVRCWWKRRLRHRTASENAPRMLVITTRDRAAQTIRSIKLREAGRVQISGLVLMPGEDAAVDDAAEEDGAAQTDPAEEAQETADAAGEEEDGMIEGVPIVCDIADTADYICREWVDEVFVRYPRTQQIDWQKMRDLSMSGVVIHLKLEDGYDTIGNRQIIDTVGGFTVMTATMNAMSHRQAFFKRALDILGGLVGCAITGVLYLFVAPQIKKASPGPVFFKQTRIGRNGKKFEMYKFRSMYPDAEERKAQLLSQNRVEDGMMFKMDFDPRVIGNEILPDGTHKTGIGDFIRRTSIDEFPQFFNVLKGEMSLVGTRPPTVGEWEKYELRHRARLAIKPGITGMWQISGRSDITDFEEVVQLDVRYITEWSMGLDFRILFKTVVHVLRGDGAL